MNRKSKSRRNKAMFKKFRSRKLNDNSANQMVEEPVLNDNLNVPEKTAFAQIQLEHFSLQKPSEEIMKTKPSSISDETILNTLKSSDKTWFVNYLTERLPQPIRNEIVKLSGDELKIPQIFPDYITWKEIIKEPPTIEISNCVFFYVGLTLMNTQNPQLPNNASSSSSFSNKSSTKGEVVLQLKITMRYIEPKIWRRIQVLNTDTFEDLHNYIQEAMGWRSYHLHQFEARNPKTKSKVLIVSNDDDLYPCESFMGHFFKNDECAKTLKEEKTKLSKYFSNVGDTVFYEYDFGDGWEHKIVLETILPYDNNNMYPKCIAGKRACPPEDCGGVTGYDHLLKVFKDPSHEEYEEYITDWLERFYPGFDPEEFDPESVF